MVDEPQAPENEERSEEEQEAFAEHRAVPTEEATEVAGSVEDAALEAFEEAQAAAAPVEESARPVEEPAVQTPAAEETVVAEPPAEVPAVAQAPVAEPAAEAAVVEADEAFAPEPTADAPVAEETATPETLAVVDEASEVAAVEEPVAEQPSDEESTEEEDFEEEEDEEPALRVKPAVPGAHLEVDIVPEGVDPLGRDRVEDPYAIEDEEPIAGEGEEAEEEEALPEPISTAAIDLAAGARYHATGKRKTAIARVILRPGSGTYKINGRSLEEYFPRATLQRNIRQPLETVGYEERMDVVARLHGGGVSAQAGALRHGVSRALLEADPNLRGELKRRGFLTRDSRAKERKKAGLKKARKRPQFSKR
jgi:small subunit ribosomal protein S9